MVCPKCGNADVVFNTVSEQKRRGILTVLIYIVLLCIPVLGWIVLFSLLRGRKSKVKNVCVCKLCGYSWQLKGKVKGC